MPSAGASVRNPPAVPDDDLGGLQGRVAFPRDDEDAPEAMQAARDIEQHDDRRDIGMVAGDHPFDQAEVPEQDEREEADAREDEPGQQRIAPGQFRSAFVHADMALTAHGRLGAYRPARQEAWASVLDRLGQYARSAARGGRLGLLRLPSRVSGDQYEEGQFREAEYEPLRSSHLAPWRRCSPLPGLRRRLGVDRRASRHRERGDGIRRPGRRRPRDALLARTAMARQPQPGSSDTHPGMGDHGDHEGDLAGSLHHLHPRQGTAAAPVQPARDDQRSGAGLVQVLL